MGLEYTINIILRIYSYYKDQSNRSGYFCSYNEIFYREIHFKLVASHMKEHSSCNEVFTGEKESVPFALCFPLWKQPVHSKALEGS